ncbi:cyclodeaminase/cyclohydrolase family protein [Desulfurispora thermophila]|uniref:cyclodeaminase/cyclohydrolase family protein n=1 Tax=Desulfurispora thermophila TaxID=265470 RepID=UPI000371AD8F|nr:cyclodeaminase/cyclohydrolase family protein [Desulfurispora thermophila]
MQLLDMTVREFLQEVAANSPAPGGGSVAALAGALGAALAGMVANLSSGKEAAGAGPQMQRLKAGAARLQDSLGRAVEEDTQVFQRVMQAYRLPRGTEEEKAARSAAIQQALKDAARYPLQVAEQCREVLHLCREAAVQGNQNALSDAAVGALLAHSGLVGALYNVAINLASIKDEQFSTTAREQVRALLVQGEAALAEVRAVVQAALSFPQP